MSKYTFGLDFGTESARAVLVDVATGEIIATAVEPYPDGVIDQTLPGSDIPLPPDWALQNPLDWLNTLEATVIRVMAESRVKPEEVIGLGIDFTACTIVPTNAEGTPLHILETARVASATISLRNQPHAWAKLWKHHAAQFHADLINELAQEKNMPWLPCYGGKISSEWLLPKAWQMLQEAPQIYAAADRLVEGGDWVVWQLTGVLARNTCAVGYKATWHKPTGFPTPDFLAALHPGLADLYTGKLAGPILPPGVRVGGLGAGWAERLGLRADIPVAAPIIDAHAAVLGSGVTAPETMLMIMGTSTCHLVMAENEVMVEGIAGVVEDGIVPGLFGYEAGQAGVGDLFAWFVANSVPPAYHAEAAARGLSLHHLLADKAALLRPGESGLLALDWWNGNRSTLVDAELSGLLLGATLATTPEEIYRALIEATAFGTRLIIETFVTRGVPIKGVVAGGGLVKNEFLMQLYADITGREIMVAGSEQPAALGAAMLGAVAAGQAAGGYDSLAEAAQHMAPPPTKLFRPTPEWLQPYTLLYNEYRRLYDYFGRRSQVMKVLRRMRRGQL